MIGRQLTTAWWTRLAGTACLLSLLAAPAAAQTEAGVRAGISVNPEQFYFGGHVQSPPVADRIHFRPNLEIGVGDDVTIAAVNVEFAYVFESPNEWSLYAGAGPALNLIKRRDDTDAEPGLNFFAGVFHENGLFVEFKVGAFDSPRVKLGVGYAFTLR